MNTFNYAGIDGGLPVNSPEKLGINPDWLDNFLDRLDNVDLPIHSAIVMRHGQLCMETYYEPYNETSLHRMFSITKSFVSMAIGLLCDEGKISLTDKIVDYFHEKQPTNGPYPYTAMMTIKDMLAMTSCHNQTTYKASGVTDWVGSFFTTRPNHIPGTNFSYDTSATHTLGALVEKVSGMKIIDYLRVKALNRIGFSQDAFCLCDPYGVSMGGSGLCATSRDILRMIMLISQDGEWRLDENGNPCEPIQLLPKEYVKEAKTKQSDPYGKQGSLEEMQGYGYQIWMTRHNGFVLYGMGGQLALYLPEKDVILVTTADAQGRGGGVQLIYDAFYEEVYNKIDADSDIPVKLDKTRKHRKLFTMPGAASSPVIDKINDKVYICDPNESGVKDFLVHFNDDNSGGFIEFTNDTGKKHIDFKIGDNALGIFPDYNLKYAASGAWRMDSYFLIKLHIIDTAVGNMFIGLNFKNDYITVMFRKIEESLFNEYNSVFSGKLS